MRCCTCIGHCYGKSGLAPGWVCAMEMDSILSRHPADPFQDEIDEVTPCGSCENCGIDLFYWDESPFCEACERGLGR